MRQTISRAVFLVCLGSGILSFNPAEARFYDSLVGCAKFLRQTLSPQLETQRFIWHIDKDSPAVRAALESLNADSVRQLNGLSPGTEVFYLGFAHIEAGDKYFAPSGTTGMSVGKATKRDVGLYVENQKANFPLVLDTQYTINNGKVEISFFKKIRLRWNFDPGDLQTDIEKWLKRFGSAPEKIIEISVTRPQAQLLMQTPSGTFYYFSVPNFKKENVDFYKLSRKLDTPISLRLIYPNGHSYSLRLFRGEPIHLRAPKAQVQPLGKDNFRN